MAIAHLLGGENCYELDIESAHDLEEALDILHTIVLDGIKDDRLLHILSHAIDAVTECRLYDEEQRAGIR